MLMQSRQTKPRMRFFSPIYALVLLALTSPLLAEAAPPPMAADIERQDPDIDIYALIPGHCPTLKIAGQNFACKTIGFFHGLHGRVSYTVVLDDPADDNHVISFSGPGSRQAVANFYYLSVDRVFLNSKDRPREDGVPIPLPVTSTGNCKQVGSLLARQISSIACNATDGDGKTYEVQFKSDGGPILVRRIRASPADSPDPPE
jgi:hypothetical protein